MLDNNDKDWIFKQLDDFLRHHAKVPCRFVHPKPPTAIPKGDTTPDMGDRYMDHLYYTQNDEETVIVSFTRGPDGCRRTILVLDGVTSFVNSEVLRLQLGMNFLPTSGDTITLSKQGSVWYETGRSINS